MCAGQNLCRRHGLKQQLQNAEKLALPWTLMNLTKGEKRTLHIAQVFGLSRARPVFTVGSPKWILVNEQCVGHSSPNMKEKVLRKLSRLSFYQIIRYTSLHVTQAIQINGTLTKGDDEDMLAEIETSPTWVCEHRQILAKDFAEMVRYLHRRVCVVNDGGKGRYGVGQKGVLRRRTCPNCK